MLVSLVLSQKDCHAVSWLFLESGILIILINIPNLITRRYVLYLGGYEGYGLTTMVEYFCSVLSGATITPNVRNWKDMLKPADLVCNSHLTPIFLYYSQELNIYTFIEFYLYRNPNFDINLYIFQGQCFVAINPDAFAPGFTDRSGLLMNALRNLEPVSSIITLHNDFYKDFIKMT